MVERSFDRVQVREDIGVVEFEVVDDRDFWEVMNELTAFIEESCVVFVTLDNKPITIGEASPLAEVIWNTPNEIARVQPVMFEHPGQQRRCGCFTMRTSHHHRPFATNKKVLEQ